ncbi:MAG TPA: efflux RND transporter periplasmic adaptor subunit [Candidatus Dormibacteraeota bacterium]|jgi:RND family efflux transporter MFP subunit|nr:efflux RND transporter periplasmic adaptor subunit [Candidatus Dormibacteraeota bacterium]
MIGANWRLPRVISTMAGVAIAGTVLAGCGKGGPVNVTVAIAGARNVADAPGGLGPVVAVADVPVTIDPILFKGRVQVLSVSVIAGAHVTKGTPLFSIDPNALQANADVLSAQLQAALAAVAREQAAVGTINAEAQQAAGIQAQIDALTKAIASDRANIAAAQANPPTAGPNGQAPANQALLQAQRQLNSDTASLGGAQGQLAGILAKSAAASAGGAQTIASLQGQVSVDQQLLAIATGASSTIAAPIDGDVVAVNVLPGQAATPGVPLVEILDPSKLRTTAKFPISEQRLVIPGSKATLTFSAVPGVTLQGTVVTVIPVTSDGLTFQAVIEADNNGATKVLPGLTASVSVAANVAALVAVPRLCVLDIDQNPYVYTVDSSKVAHRKTVQLGAADADSVQIASGMSAGDRCVVNGTQLLEDGSKVNVTATRA